MSLNNVIKNTLLYSWFDPHLKRHHSFHLWREGFLTRPVNWRQKLSPISFDFDRGNIDFNFVVDCTQMLASKIRDSVPYCV